MTGIAILSPGRVALLAAAALVALAINALSKVDPATATKAGPMDLTTEQAEQFATLINLNGHLCARVIEARRRADPKMIYVECERRRDSLSRVAYEVDLASGKVKP